MRPVSRAAWSSCQPPIVATALPVVSGAAVRCYWVGMAVRPADVPLTYCAALGLVDRDLDRDEVTVTALARTYLVDGSPFDLRAYYASLAERPACRELATVLRTGDACGVGQRDRPDRRGRGSGCGCGARTARLVVAVGPGLRLTRRPIVRVSSASMGHQLHHWRIWPPTEAPGTRPGAEHSGEGCERQANCQLPIR
jgi:hypothetical protein